VNLEGIARGIFVRDWGWDDSLGNNERMARDIRKKLTRE